MAAATKQMAISGGEPGQLVPYGLTEVQISELRQQYAGLTFDTTADYDAGRKAIAHVRSLRTAVEVRRVELKAAHLERGRRIDAAAKALTGLLLEIETPLKERKDAIDNAKEVARRAVEEAERVAREEKAKAERLAEEARIAADRERLAAERAVFEEAQRKADEERRERDAAEKAERTRIGIEQREAQAKLDLERLQLENMQRAVREQEEKAAQTERLRLARIRADEELAADTEREKARSEARRIEMEQQAAEAARIEAQLRPDREKLVAWAAEIRGVIGRAPIVVDSDAAADAIKWATERLGFVAGALEKFKAKEAGI